MKKITWKEMNNLDIAALSANNASGIYVIGVKDEIEGLPTKFEWVYVGQSKNLGRRLKEHLPQNEKNYQLRNWLIKNINKLVVMFTFLSEDELDEKEKYYIESLNPVHNTIYNRVKLS